VVDSAHDRATDADADLEGETADMDTAEVLAARARVRRWLREKVALQLSLVQLSPARHVW
jgi:hypothetical protein